MRNPSQQSSRGKEFVVLDDPRFAQCHASTVLPLPGGEVLAAWFAGSREGAGDTGIWLARRTGGGWDRPRRVAAEPGLPHWNPVLFRGRRDEILLFYKAGRRIPSWRTRLIRSLDGGRTWSAPRELVPGDEGGRGPVKNKPIVLSDGTWLAPASVEGETWDAFVDLSADGGVSWQRSSPVPIDRANFPGLGVIQPAVWESAPGQVRMLLRSSSGWVCRSESHDGGRTWSPVTATSLPNNNSGLDALRLPDGLVVCAHNPVGTEWGVRTPLVLSVSMDDGLSWRQCLVLEDLAPPANALIVPDEEGIRTDGRAEFSYPALVPHEGGIAVTYTWQRRGIAFVHVPRADLAPGGPV